MEEDCGLKGLWRRTNTSRPIRTKLEFFEAQPDHIIWSYGYSDKIEYTVRARRYTNNDGVQSMSRRLQYHVVDGHTIDLDIQNCCLTLLQQILAEVDPQPPLPDNLKLLDRLVNDWAGVLKQLGLHIVEGKEMINTVLNGGNPPPTLKNNEIVRDLQRISQYVRWVACNLLHSDYMSLAENKQKTFPSSTILSLLWTSIEDRILQGWTERVLNNPNKPKHLSLHFDGIRISADHVGSSQDDFIKDCENAIKMRTGFMVKIAAKKHSSFIDLVKSRSTHANSLTNVPGILQQPGNCIPCAFWHMLPLARPAVVAAISDESSAKNSDAKSMRYRDYRSVASMCSLDIVSCIGLPALQVKSFVLHYEGNGDKSSGQSALLLDMVSGARDSPDESEEDASDDVAEAHTASSTGKISFNEDKVPVFTDIIMGCLYEETSTVMKDLQRISERCEGRRRASYRSRKHVRDEAPFGDDVAWRRLLTVRGRTGAVLMMHPLQNESSEQLVDALSQHFSVEQLRAVVHIGTDSPSEKLFKQLKEICPSMQSLILDPIRLAIVYEYGFWNKKSPGSKQLRRILKKCTAVDDDLGRDCWGAFYDVTNAHLLGEEEIRYRDMITSSSMTVAESKNILDGLNMEAPFTNRLDYIMSLAALCQRYPAEVDKRLLVPTSKSARFYGLHVRLIGWSG
eukprot:s4863_g1.t1